MDCNHNIVISESNFNSGGYMRIKFCTLCHYTSGSGFIDENHEIGYLEKLLDTPG